jgi:hypothetical protein
MEDTAGWIQLLFKRMRAGHSLRTSFLLGLTNEQIAMEAHAQPGGRDQLRQVSLAALASDDLEKVAIALVCLGVVGDSEDLHHVDPLVGHDSDLVRRAARTCRFELLQISRG